MKIMFHFICIIILTSFSASVFADSYAYDANGNMLQDSGKGQCYVYNEANQLKEVNNCSGSKIASYWYDYTGRRIKTVEYNRTGGNLTTYYPFPDAEIVINGTQTLNTTYYFANGERVARRDPNGSMHYYSGDHLGSTSVVTDSAGNLEEKTRYLPFGDTLSHTGVNLAKYLYTGQEKDTESGLYYYGARYYDPRLPRFIQPDTYTSNIYNPQDLNPYSYVQNNPIKYTDPSGHEIMIIFAEDELVPRPLAPLLEESDKTISPTAPLPEQEGTPPIDSLTKSAGTTDNVCKATSSDDNGGWSLKKARSEFNNKVRPSYWKEVAQKSPTDWPTYTQDGQEADIPNMPENVNRMSKGKAPKAEDQTSIELPHKEQLNDQGNNQDDNLKPMHWYDHRGGPNFKLNHPDLWMAFTNTCNNYNTGLNNFFKNPIPPTDSSNWGGGQTASA